MQSKERWIAYCQLFSRVRHVFIGLVGVFDDGKAVPAD